MPRKRYDFTFVYNDRNYIIEYDGIQHFTRIDFFCPNENSFNQRRDVDINKTIAALNAGYILIRISYLDKIDIDQILNECLYDPDLETKLILSNVQQYNWLLQKVPEYIH